MGSMLVPIVMFGWIPVVLLLFAALPPRRAVLAAFLLAWLFLPIAGYRLSGIPDYNKMSATSLGVLLGVLFFDTSRLTRFRFSLLDLPMLIWCICPFASSMANGLGPYDGVSASVTEIVRWGIPYLIGRLYFQTAGELRALAIAVFIGGLIYVPLCLLEVRMSPQLHRWVYGYHQHSWIQTRRDGGFRPTVFMEHGLMVGAWMCNTALLGLWLWYTRVVPRYRRGIQTVLAVATLVVTAILVKSTGAILLLLVGSVVLAITVGLRAKWVVFILIAIAPLYMISRASALWDGTNVVQWSRDWFGEERANSMSVRIQNENALASKALRQPVFGWGGWARGRIRTEEGRYASVTDGLWTIILGDNGIVGLAAWTSAMLLPVYIALRRLTVRDWVQPSGSSILGLGVVVVLYVIDCIPNAMLNPIFTLVVGAIAAFAVRVPEGPLVCISGVDLSSVPNHTAVAAGQVLG